MVEDVGVTDTIRNSGLGDRRRYPWRGRLPGLVEHVAIWAWGEPYASVLEVIGIALIAYGLGRGWV